MVVQNDTSFPNDSFIISILNCNPQNWVIHIYSEPSNYGQIRAKFFYLLKYPLFFLKPILYSVSSCCTKAVF